MLSVSIELRGFGILHAWVLRFQPCNNIFMRNELTSLDFSISLCEVRFQIFVISQVHSQCVTQNPGAINLTM